MNAPLARIRRGATFLGAFFLVAVIVHRTLTGKTWLESIYWFVITVSSVGYAEESSAPPALQLFTIVVIIVGLSAAGYVIGGFLQLVWAGEVERLMGVRRMTREISQLEGHVIICGFGRIGKILADDLTTHYTDFVVVENDPEVIGELKSSGYLSVAGDATEEDVLRSAGVERARTLVVALQSDANNVFLTLTAKNLNPNLHVIARGEQPSTEKKLLQAGADRVVLPAVIGARRIANMVTRPHTADMIDLVIDRHIMDADLEELTIRQPCPLAGMSVRDTATRQRHKLSVVAIRRADGEMIVNPDPDVVLQEGDTIIVIGKRDDVKRFRADYGL